jgi:hypothetical protein
VAFAALSIHDAVGVSGFKAAGEASGVRNCRHWARRQQGHHEDKQHGDVSNGAQNFHFSASLIGF